MLSLIFIFIHKRENKKRYAVIYYRLLHAPRNIKKFLLFSRGRAISLPRWLAILLIFQNERTVAHGEMPPFSRRKDRTVPWGTYDFTNDLTRMHLPALRLLNNTWKTFRYAPWCSLVLLDEKRKHSGRISLDLPSLYPCSSLFPSVSVSSQQLLFRTSSNGTRILF